MPGIYTVVTSDGVEQDTFQGPLAFLRAFLYASKIIHDGLRAGIRNDATGQWEAALTTEPRKTR